MNKRTRKKLALHVKQLCKLCKQMNRIQSEVAEIVDILYDTPDFDDREYLLFKRIPGGWATILHSLHSTIQADLVECCEILELKEKPYGY